VDPELEESWRRTEANLQAALQAACGDLVGPDFDLVKSFIEHN
jgi:hypothetical protein